MKKVKEGVLLTPKEASGIADVLRIIAYMDNCDEIVGCDIPNERKSAKRLYNRIQPLLVAEFIGASQENH